MRKHRWEISCDLCKRPVTEVEVSAVRIDVVAREYGNRIGVEVDVCVGCHEKPISTLMLAASRIAGAPVDERPR